MLEPVRVQLSRAKGWRIPDNTVVVSRPSKWGNLFIVGQDGTREDCRRWFAHLMNGGMLMCGTPTIEEMRAYRKFASRNLWRLKGKNLACWCGLCAAHKAGKPLNLRCDDCKPCHVDPLGLFANPPEAA